MHISRYKALVLNSKLRQLVLFLYRVFLILRNLFKTLQVSLVWLLKRREFTNFTYDLQPTNKEYLAWFVANACNVSVTEILGYFDEIESNVILQTELAIRMESNRHGKEFAGHSPWGRRIGWYAIARATKPNLIVESGTEKGLGSVILSEALLQNGSGRLITIDNDPYSGWLIQGRHLHNTEQIIKSSLSVIKEIDQIDLFIHDSDHSQNYESKEYELVQSCLSKQGYVLSDNSHVTNSLSNWSLINGRNFMYFSEQPLNHWYPGAGIGISIPSKDSQCK